MTESKSSRTKDSGEKEERRRDIRLQGSSLGTVSTLSLLCHNLQSRVLLPRTPFCDLHVIILATSKYSHSRPCAGSMSSSPSREECFNVIPRSKEQIRDCSQLSCSHRGLEQKRGIRLSPQS